MFTFRIIHKDKVVSTQRFYTAYRVLRAIEELTGVDYTVHLDDRRISFHKLSNMEEEITYLRDHQNLEDLDNTYLDITGVQMTNMIWDQLRGRGILIMSLTGEYYLE